MELDLFEITTPEERARMRSEGEQAGPSGQWKVVWSNGDELYVEADCRSSAIRIAARTHGDTAATIIYCRRYG